MPSSSADKRAVEDVMQRLLRMFPAGASLHEPTLGEREKAYVADALSSGWVSTVGPYVDQFEAMVAEYTGAVRAIATVNGTTALHLALRVVGVEPGNEVLMPALSFVATANAAVHAGAIPHFVDISDRTLGLSHTALQRILDNVAEIRSDGSTWNRTTGRRIAACVPMHVFGHPAEIEEIVAICEEWHIPVVEDAAESLGSLRNGRHTGTFGTVGIISFNGNKIVTTGGGGAILTMDADLGTRIKHLSTTAKLPHPYEYVHDDVGYNYRLPNINAALGCAQMERLPEMLLKKRALAREYMAVFGDFTGGAMVDEPEDCRSNFWLNALILDAETTQARQPILEASHSYGIRSRPVWKALNSLPMYTQAPSGPLPVTLELEPRIVNLPSSAFLLDKIP